MKTLTGIGLALLLLVPGARADTSAYAAIVKEREAVLVQIVTQVESRHALGAVSDEALYGAKLALHSFRRDTAPAVADKVRHQQEIVALQQQQLDALQARARAGTTDSLEKLRATDALLAAKQELEELKALVASPAGRQ